jgi:hypothetical protein
MHVTPMRRAILVVVHVEVEPARVAVMELVSPPVTMRFTS